MDFNSLTAIKLKLLPERTVPAASNPEASYLLLTHPNTNNITKFSSEQENNRIMSSVIPSGTFLKLILDYLQNYSALKLVSATKRNAFKMTKTQK